MSGAQGSGSISREHVPEARRPYVAKQLREAYRSKSAKTARKLLQQLASWLESNGDDCAAESLREGLEETLTIVKLGLHSSLGRTFATTIQLHREHERNRSKGLPQREALARRSP